MGFFARNGFVVMIDNHLNTDTTIMSNQALWLTVRHKAGPIGPVHNLLLNAVISKSVNILNAVNLNADHNPLLNASHNLLLNAVNQ